MKTVNTKDNKPEVFFPVDNIDFIKKFKIDRELSVNYFRSRYVFHDDYNDNIDFTKNIPGFGTVVQWGIILAIYMGFKEIYLLGCDNTGIIVTINSALQENTNDDYAYDISENEKRRMESLLKINTLEDYCKSYTATLSGFR